MATGEPTPTGTATQPVIRTQEGSGVRWRSWFPSGPPSPDLTILPVFLAAAAVGTGTAIGSLLAFALVTIATIVGLTLYPLATIAGYFLPTVGIVLFGLLVLFFMLPRNVEAIIVRPELDSRS